MNYYQMNFVSADSLFAEVKEELRSYFDSGIVDEMLFLTWTDRCLKRIRKAAYPIDQVVLNLCDYQAELPCDFKAVRELWACAESFKDVRAPIGNYYYQTDCRITQITDPCNICSQQRCICPVPSIKTASCSSNCSPCSNQQFIVTNKITANTILQFATSFLLKPGNVSAKNHCGEHSPNLTCSSLDTFDIKNNKVITNFPTGTLYLVYYSENIDANGDQLIPDDFWVQDYIRKFIQYKVFEMVSNQVTDETFNQSMQKVQYYKQLSDEAFIMCDIELKKQTKEQRIDRSIRTQTRYNRFHIPNGRRR